MYARCDKDADNGLVSIIRLFPLMSLVTLAFYLLKSTGSFTHHDKDVDAVEMKGRNWILHTFQYEEKTISRHYTQIRNIEKGGE